MAINSLASYRRSCQRISEIWPEFLAKRESRLSQQIRFGSAAEKVAENIVEDLFTMVLDWSLSDVNNQVSYADVVLTRLGIKHLIIEVKRPGSLQWNRRSIDAALAQAQRYADEQKVKCIAVSDGAVLYARDVVSGGHRDRLFVRLDAPDAPMDLWWLCVDGIYRTREDFSDVSPWLLPDGMIQMAGNEVSVPGDLLHPKYHLPHWCFAYVGDATNPKTWHLPYLLGDGSPDLARLPKAVQAILTNYRGARVSAIPEKAIPEVLVTLARTASQIGKLPVGGPSAPATYVQLQQALEQLGRISDVFS